MAIKRWFYRDAADGALKELASTYDEDGDLVVGGLVDGRDLAVDGAKLDGIEAGATADQTAAQIKTLYESNANTNEFDDAEQTKLAGIESGATADQSNAEIKTAYEANADTNAFTDADESKLDGIEAGADVTDATNVDAAGAVMESDTTTASMSFVLDEDDLSSDSATKLPTQQSVKAYVDASIASNVAYQGGYNASTNTPDLDTAPSGVKQGHQYTVTVAGTFFATALEVGDFMIAEQDDPTLESHWTVVQKDMDASSIKASYESNSDTNAFTDAEQTKLAGIETAADVTDATNVDAAGAVMEADTTTAAMGFVLDEDTLASDSATKLATQQSIKAYVDANGDLWSDPVDADIVPDTDSTRSLGSTLKRFLAAFVDAITVTGDITVGGTVDGRDVATDGTKLDGIETGATADQTNSEIKTAYEANADTNAFTDAEQTKLAGIETAADVTDTANVDAAGAVMNTDTTTGAMSFVLDEDTMVSNSATKVATQQSIKAYVDASVSTDDQTAAEVPFTPDGDIAATDTQAAIVEVRDDTDTKLAGKSATGHTHVLADVTDSGTMASQNAASVNIDGGNIDGTVIGATTPAAADFTTVDTTGDVVVGGDITTNGADVVGAETGSISIKGSDSGVTSVHANADDLFIESSGFAGITLAAPNNKGCGLYFSDPQSEFAGWVQYVHTADRLDLAAGVAVRVALTAATTQVNNDLSVTGALVLDTTSELTISAGVVTATSSRHTIDTESDASTDDLDTINGGSDGQLIVLSQAADARDVTLTEAGNLQLKDGDEVNLENVKNRITLQYNSGTSKWVEICRSFVGSNEAIGTALQIATLTISGASTATTATAKDDTDTLTTTDGAEHGSLAFTPTSSTSKIHVSIIGRQGHENANNRHTATFLRFEQGATDIIAGLNADYLHGNYSAPVCIDYVTTLSSASEITLSIRSVLSYASDHYLNRTRLESAPYGVTAQTIMTVTEFA